MGNSNSGVMAIIAVLGLAYLFSRPQETEVSTLNGSLFPWLSPSTIEKETIILKEMRTTHTYYTEKGEHFHTVLEDAEGTLEDIELDVLSAKTLLGRARELDVRAKALSEMVQPTTTFDPTKLSQLELDRAQALAEQSRPAAGMWHPESVPN